MRLRVGIETRLPEAALPFGWIGQTAVAAASRGVDIEAQLLALGINAGGDALRPDTPLDAAEYMLMCVRVINAVRDEMHGATHARMRPGTAELGLKLLGAEPTLGDAIPVLFRFYAIAGGFCHAEFERDEHCAIISIRADAEACDLTAVVEEMMATHLHMLFSAYLGFFLPLYDLTTTSPRHPNLSARHAYLGAPVVLGRTTRIAFPAAFLDRPAKAPLADVLSAALHWLACFEPAPRGELGVTLSGETSGLVYRKLLAQDDALEACCAELGLKPRTLRAALSAEGSSYRQLRRCALVERVRPYLDAHATAEDIAFGLGYSDGRSLRRALKLATGLTLSDMRGQASSAASIRPELLRNLRVEIGMMS